MRCTCGGERRPIGSTSGGTVWYCGRCDTDVTARYVPASGRMEISNPRGMPGRVMPGPPLSARHPDVQAALDLADRQATREAATIDEARATKAAALAVPTVEGRRKKKHRIPMNTPPAPQQHPTFRPLPVPAVAPEPTTKEPEVGPADDPPGSVQELPPTEVEAVVAAAFVEANAAELAASQAQAALAAAGQVIGEIEAAREAAARQRDEAVTRFVRAHHDHAD